MDMSNLPALEHHHMQATFGPDCLASLQAMKIVPVMCADVTPAVHCQLTQIRVLIQPTSRGAFGGDHFLLQIRASVITLSGLTGLAQDEPGWVPTVSQLSHNGLHGLQGWTQVDSPETDCERVPGALR